MHGQAGQVLVAEPHRAGVGGHQPDHHVEAGRLAGAVGAEQADHLARLDVEGDAVHDPPAAVALHQPVGAELAPHLPPPAGFAGAAGLAGPLMTGGALDGAAGAGAAGFFVTGSIWPEGTVACTASSSSTSSAASR